MGSAASWEHWDSGSIPGLAQWVKNPLLLQLQLRLRPQLRSDPWPSNSICHEVAKNAKKKKKKKKKKTKTKEARKKNREKIASLVNGVIKTGLFSHILY